MSDADRGTPALRVERGTVTGEELAALTVVLLALCGRPAGDEAPPRPVDGPGWRRTEGQRGVRARW